MPMANGHVIVRPYISKRKRKNISYIHKSHVYNSYYNTIEHIEETVTTNHFRLCALLNEKDIKI